MLARLAVTLPWYRPSCFSHVNTPSSHKNNRLIYLFHAKVIHEFDGSWKLLGFSFSFLENFIKNVVFTTIFLVHYFKLSSGKNATVQKLFQSSYSFNVWETFDDVVKFAKSSQASRVMERILQGQPTELRTRHCIFVYCWPQHSRSERSETFFKWKGATSKWHSRTIKVLENWLGCSH